MKNSRVWDAIDTTTSIRLGRFLSSTRRPSDVLKEARRYWPNAKTIRVKRIK